MSASVAKGVVQLHSSYGACSAAAEGSGAALPGWPEREGERRGMAQPRLCSAAQLRSAPGEQRAAHRRSAAQPTPTPCAVIGAASTALGQPTQSRSSTHSPAHSSAAPASIAPGAAALLSLPPVLASSPEALPLAHSLRPPVSVPSPHPMGRPPGPRCCSYGLKGTGERMAMAGPHPAVAVFLSSRAPLPSCCQPSKPDPDRAGRSVARVAICDSDRGE